MFYVISVFLVPVSIAGVYKYVTGEEDNNSHQEGPFMKANAREAEQGNFSDILEILGLDKYYPSKISLLDAMVIKKFNGHPKLVDLPWLVIHKLLMTDFHARDQLLSDVSKSSREERPDNSDISEVEAFLAVQSTGVREDNATHLNPLDVLVAIFTCCDSFLKQTLAHQMFICKLAIPFLYPVGPEGNIWMSVWALRTIILQRHTKLEEAVETTVTGNSFPLVTFLRLGRPPLSKSKLVNDILRDDSHDTFFHKDCINGTIPRRMTDGLVECSWFIKVGAKNDHLPGTTMILNLRGDASLMKKQMQILREISSVIFVTASAKDLTIAQNTMTFQRILKSSAKVILLLISGKNKQITQDLQACHEIVPKGVPIILSSTLQGTLKNASDLKTEAREKLSEAIAGCNASLMVEECALRAKKMGIIIDEHDDEACLKGKALAEEVVSHMEGKHIFDCKSLLLPVQCAEWTEYCEVLKNQHRIRGQVTQSTSAYHYEEVKRTLGLLREQQVEIYQSRLTPFIKTFMSNLRNNPDVAMYFLSWIDLLLNEVSRTNLPGLRRQYHTALKEFRGAKKKQERANLPQLKAQVDDAEGHLARASFGLENLFREIGQIYEAVKGSRKVGQDTKADVEILPEIAAKLLLKGRPLELVDGDTSTVPITWVTAVLSKLGNIIGEKRLFVLSVLGIQSSGKSTLLNTMFGLQFAVSAGRCTRGAYMQIIPVEGNADLPFDYVVVIDTEGLRAPELQQLMYEHDNELVTFVIGLGDVTMINIKGENTAEIKYILQIAMHAFLRMNLVSKRVQDHRTCIFVHQNVPSPNAEELMIHGHHKLEESLNEMTKEAALSENIANIHSFSQMINFGVKTHVWYFPDLWHGNPPMAPANPGYSEKVDALRLNLFEEIAKRQTTFLTSSDLSIRLADLWNGVLADDFVFSFCNSLEVKAYNSLQSKYYTLEWDLQNSMKSWLHFAGLKLEICESIDDLESSFLSLTVELSKVLTKKAEKTKYYLKEYFNICNLRDITIQWQQFKLNQLNFAVEQQQNEGEVDLRSIKEARRVEIMHTQKWSKHEAYIMNRAVKLAEEMKGKEVTDPEQEKKFDTMWLSMVNELAPNTEDKELQMDLVMEGILFQRFHAHGALLREELKRHSLNIPLEQTSLESSITLDDVRQEHVTLKTSLLKNIENLADERNRELEAARQMTLVMTRSILEEIDIYLKNISNQDMKFRKTHAAYVVKILVEKIETFNQNAYVSNDYNFTIIPGYAVKLAVHVSRHCVQVFSSMQLKYNNKHGVKAKLQVYKNTARSLFKNKVKQSNEEVLAGDLLCTHLKGVVQKAVKKAIPRKCIDEVLRDFQMTKYYLLVKMLEDLADNESFREYKAYFNDGKWFALTWITRYTNKKMFSRQGVNGMSRYAEIANSHIARIIRCITQSVENATADVEGQRDRRMERWIEKFCQSASEEIVVPVSTLTFVSDRLVVNFDNLTRIVLNQLGQIQVSLQDTFAIETENSVDWDGKPPSLLIIDKIWGCPEQCPFCHSPCVDNTPRHFSLYGRRHTCVQHRPRGLLGVRIFAGVKTGKNQLLNQTCNYIIQGKDMEFGCDACDFKCRDSGKCSATGMNIVYHKYPEYKTYLPEWDIAPDSTNSMSKYWMWVMANYKLYSDSFADVPPSWRSITKKEALADLKTIHH
ncbi:interferon-induced very large GTPase 1-like [Lytechinus pictus]|uniref:interferon-induced very large GTPase 1-like n=1 Tax=Lytechinus pictus TaxID=7653 RepID=UPI0030BA1CA4